MNAIRWVLMLGMLYPGLLLADVVHLANGNTLEGRARKTASGDIRVQLLSGTGDVTLSPRDIVRIDRKATPIDEFDRRFANLEGRQDGTADEWLGLALYAESNGLHGFARRAYERVLLIEPNNAKARAALGYKEHNGQWLTPEEYGRAMGLVPYEGAWVTPEQLAQIRNLDAQAQAEKARANEITARAAKVQAEADYLNNLNYSPIPTSYYPFYYYYPSY